MFIFGLPKYCLIAVIDFASLCHSCFKNSIWPSCTCDCNNGFFSLGSIRRARKCLVQTFKSSKCFFMYNFELCQKANDKIFKFIVIRYSYNFATFMDIILLLQKRHETYSAILFHNIDNSYETWNKIFTFCQSSELVLHKRKELDG